MFLAVGLSKKILSCLRLKSPKSMASCLPMPRKTEVLLDVLDLWPGFVMFTSYAQKDREQTCQGQKRELAA